MTHSDLHSRFCLPVALKVRGKEVCSVYVEGPRLSTDSEIGLRTNCGQI